MLEFRLSETQLEKLSDIASDVGLIGIASIVLPAVFDRFDILKIFVGIIITVFFWAHSLWLRR